MALLDKFLFDETMDDPEAHEVSRELINFLHYVENVDGEIAYRFGSERLQKIHTCVSRVKRSEHVGVKYLQRWEEEWVFREEGRLSALLESVCNLMKKTGVTAGEAMEMLGIEPAVRDALYEKMNSDADMK